MALLMQNFGLLSLCVTFALAGCEQAWQRVAVREAPKDLPFQVEWVDQHADLKAVFFIDQDRGWAVGQDGVILATRDGGTKWEPQWSGVKGWLADLHFIDQKTGWAVGGEEVGVLYTSDGGATWTRDPRPKIDAAHGVQFIDSQTGWLMGSAILLRTSDGGKNWSRFKTPKFGYVHFVDVAHGWATGDGSVFATADGGATWEALETGNTLPLRTSPENTWPLLSLYFVSQSNGWVTTHDTVFRTKDGGKKWLGDQEKAYYKNLRFVDELTGWATGEDWRLLQTADGGETWQTWRWPERSREPGAFDGLHFPSRTHGWAVGDRGAILATKDGGKSWLQQNKVPTPEELGLTAKDVITSHAFAVKTDPRIPQFELNPHQWTVSQVLFANATTGWAVGTLRYDLESDPDGQILSTANGGGNWTQTYLQWNPLSIYYKPEGDLFVFAEGMNRRPSRPSRAGSALIRGQPVNRAPWVNEFAVREDPLKGLVLRWKAHDEIPATVTTTLVEFSPGTDRNFGALESKDLEREPDGSFSLAFNPSDYGIAAGAAVYYRVTLKDGRGLAFLHQIPRAFTYSSWWSRQPAAVQVLVALVTLAGAFYVVCWGLLHAFPLALLWLHEHAPLEKLTELVPSNTVKSLVEVLTSILGLSWFARHRRVRDAWLQRFASEPETAQRLSDSIQRAFLGSDAGRGIWLEHYRAGRAHLSELPGPLQQAYVEKPDFLDAWVELHAQAAEKAYGELETVRLREVWIELPIRIGEQTTGDYVTNPSRGDFRALFARERIIAEIIGEGGTGKSTLSIQLGRWALAAEPDARLATHRMIPVLVQEETTDLVATLRGLLREMFGSGEIAEDLLASLLKQRRILVIVDALSERSEPTRKAVCAVHRAAEVNALIVTTRQPLDFGANPVVQIWPEKVTTEKLVYFLTEYLRRTGRAELFPGREALQLGDRLMAVVESGTSALQLTPLFITLFIDQAVKLRAGSQPIEQLPASIPDIILEHLRGTNPKGQTQNVDDDTLIAAARVLAAGSLGERFVPRDLFNDDAETALKEHSLGGEGTDLIERLIANSVLEQRSRGGTRILRFVLDPVAEYLAALYWLARLRGDADAWRKWLDALRAQAGYPESMRGFLVALDNCVIAYGRDFGTPDFVKFT